MLSKEQQEMVEDAMWVVNWVLKEQNLWGNEDLRQDALLYLCRCAERFNEKADTKWTTYAYKNISLYVKRKNILESMKNDMYKPEEEKPSKVISADYMETKALLKEVYSKCNDREKKILVLKLKGYKIREIAEIMGISMPIVKNDLMFIKRKARKDE